MSEILRLVDQLTELANSQGDKARFGGCKELQRLKHQQIFDILLVAVAEAKAEYVPVLYKQFKLTEYEVDVVLKKLQEAGQQVCAAMQNGKYEHHEVSQAMTAASMDEQPRYLQKVQDLVQEQVLREVAGFMKRRRAVHFNTASPAVYPSENTMSPENKRRKHSAKESAPSHCALPPSQSQAQTQESEGHAKKHRRHHRTKE